MDLGGISAAINKRGGHLKKRILSSFIMAWALVVICNSTNINGQTEKETSAKNNWHKLLLKYPPSKDAIELEPAGSFPSQEQESKGIYFAQGRHIAHDNINNIYISDMRGHAIYIFDSNGQYLNKLGQAGQGPGDLSSPHYFHITKDNTIIVGETGNMRIQFLNVNGAYLSSFKISRGYLSWITDNKGRIYAIPRLRPELTKIVEVLSPQGEVLESFGEPLKFKYEMSIYNDSRICMNDKGDLFVGFTYLPLVRKYSSDGILRKEIRIAGGLFEEKERSNLDNQARIVSGERSFYKPIVCSIRSSAKGFIFMHNYPRLEFHEYDDAGKQLNTYWIELSNDYIADTFDVLPDKEHGLKFYVLQLYPESKVDVFVPKKRH